jgi:predicted Zn-ribbon and HTH transcriptional regulator
MSRIKTVIRQQEEKLCDRCGYSEYSMASTCPHCKAGRIIPVSSFDSEKAEALKRKFAYNNRLRKGST